tara:strand:- start:1330 stop:1683 length:354 start_codon:yes stop_codon:yes gene_type:complete
MPNDINVDELAEDLHDIRMRNMRAANDMIDLDLEGLETEPKPKTDYERFIDERAAAAHLRDSMFRLLGRMEHQLFTDRLNGIPEEWLRDRSIDLQKALDEHAANRDNGLGDVEGTQI